MRLVTGHKIRSVSFGRNKAIDCANSLVERTNLSRNEHAISYAQRSYVTPLHSRIHSGRPSTLCGVERKKRKRKIFDCLCIVVRA